MADKSENVFIEGKRAPERRKRFLPRETKQAKAKNRLPSENVARIERKGVLRAAPKGGNAYTFAIVEKRAFIERKYHNRAMTSLAKAKICLLSDISARKMRFRLFERHFRSENTFSFGKRVLAPSARFRVCVFAR